MLSWITKILLLVFFIPMSQSLALSSENCSSLVFLGLESINILKLPERFRSTHDLSKLDSSAVSKKGLTSLNISGSAQFSELELKFLLKILPKNVYIVDLRRESHGFVNSLPLLWSSNQNWENRELAQSEVIQKERERIEKLRHQLQFQGIIYYPKGSSFFKARQPISFPIQNVVSEKEIVEKNHAFYQRFYVTDHMFPSDETVEEFLNFVESLPANSWLHFHCRGGRGRTTTFMVLYDILKNGKEVPLKDIIARHTLLGGINLSSINPQAVYAWALHEAHQRIERVKKFYLYVNDPQGYKVQRWKEWLSSQEKLSYRQTSVN